MPTTTSIPVRNNGSILIIPADRYTKGLEALPMHYGGAALVVLALGDPHLLEGRQRGQDGPSDPDTARGRQRLVL